VVVEKEAKMPEVYIEGKPAGYWLREMKEKEKSKEREKSKMKLESCTKDIIRPNISQ